MSVDFKKLGLDRIATGISSAVNRPTGRLVTGDITRGTVVEVVVDGGTTGSATVSARRTGAILISTDCIAHRYAWSISDTTLTVTTSGSASGEAFEFWVF